MLISASEGKVGYQSVYFLAVSLLNQLQRVRFCHGLHPVVNV